MAAWVMFLLTFYLLFHGGLAGKTTTPVPIGLIIDSNFVIGNTTNISIALALGDFYAAHPNYTTRIVIRPRDSGGDIVASASAALDLITNEGVHAIIGPMNSGEASFVATMAFASKVPVLSFTATSPAISPSSARFFVRTAPVDNAQAPAIAAVVQAFGWRRVVLVYEESDYGTRLVRYLVDALDAVGVTVPYRSTLCADDLEERILEVLYSLKTLQTRVFVVHMNPNLASLFFPLAEEAGMMGEGFVWIATTGIGNSIASFNSGILCSMDGVIGVRPHAPIKSSAFQEFKRRFRLELEKKNLPTEHSIYDLWAYETAWALALAVEVAGVGHTRTPNVSSSSLAKLSSLPISESGERLLQAIHKTKFSELGDNFRLVNGERNISAYEVVNVHDETARVIGFWTLRNGLTRKLDHTISAGYSAKREGLRNVILFPGEPRSRPKGWEIPTGGKKLKILLPGQVEQGFYSFLYVATDNETGETTAGGFVIELFEAAVRKLPYALPFEYVQDIDDAGNRSGDYNNLIKQVFHKRFDAVVGDVTITRDRSEFVDFTLPYTVSGISILSPMKCMRSKNAWLFLKPLTNGLWIASMTFFLLTGAVVWVLEHRINDEFRGPPVHQFGTVFFFAFSTLVFAHREKLARNLSKIVMVFWVFVVLILQSNYTASLTSLISVNRYEPTVTSIDALIANKALVGYLEDSYVKGLLLKWGFQPENLKPYKSLEQYGNALALGSRKGGVAAVIDEDPYIKVFLKDYCDKYAMVAPQLAKSAGFGFAFPKGSPVVADLSRAILNVTEGGDMDDIEKRWFRDQSGCKSGGSASHSLSFMSFWGLFAVSGAASLFSLVGYSASFLYANRNLWNRPDAGNFWEKVRLMGRHFDEKDDSFHTFKNPRTKEEPSHGGGNQEGYEEGETRDELMTPFSQALTTMSISGPLDDQDGRLPSPNKPPST